MKKPIFIPFLSALLPPPVGAGLRCLLPISSSAPDVPDAYSDAVKYLVGRYYSGVTHCTPSAFLRMKLGDALQQRDGAPYIYESRQAARQALATR